MAKGIVKRLNSRAAIFDVANKKGEVKEVIVFNQEMFGKDSYGSYMTHPDIFIGNEVDLTISPTLTSKYNLYNAALTERYTYDSVSRKTEDLLNISGEEFTAVTAVVNRVEKHYLTEIEAGQLDDAMFYLEKAMNLTDFEMYLGTLSQIKKFLKAAVDLETLNTHDISEELQIVIRENNVVNYLTLLHSFLNMYSKTTEGSEFKDDIEINMNNLQGIISAILESNKRFFATVMDEKYLGVDISFYETTAKVLHGDVVIAYIIPSKNGKIRAEVLAVINSNTKTFKNNVSYLETQDKYEGLTYPCFVDAKTWKTYPEEIRAMYSNKIWDGTAPKGNEYIFMSRIEDASIPNIFWRESYLNSGNLYNSMFKRKMLELFATIAKHSKEMRDNGVYVIFKGKATVITIRHDDIVYNYAVNSGELTQLSKVVDGYEEDRLKESAELVMKVLEIKKYKTT